MSRRILQSLPFVALAAGLAVTGYWLIQTAFMVYDDEGYVLWSLRMYGENGSLYERVFSQYGPLFYAYYDALRRILGLTLDHDTGRLLTLGYWLLISLTSGLLTAALARSRLAAASAAALTFVGLAAMIREPIHPGGLIAGIAMAGAALGAWALLRERPAAFALATGLAGTALALIKINVGAFFLIAAGSWLFTSTRPGRPAGWVVALGCVISPWALMQALWPASWVTHFALVFACGALALVPGIQAAARPEHGRRSWGLFLGVGLGFCAVTLLLVGLRGTRLASLWHGMVVAPLSHPGVYFFPVAWRPGSGFLALASLAACCLLQRRALSPGSVRIVALARLAAAAAFLAGSFTAEDEGLTRFALSYGPGLAWLMVLPLAGATTGGSARARLWLAWVFVWQTLHAYPVAGSQIAWGTFLWATLLACGVTEALRVLAPQRASVRAAVQVVLLAASLVAVGRLAVLGQGFYRSSEALGLRGAESLRPPQDVRHQLRALDENLRLHVDTLFSLPGLFSLNLWSERPTPTGANVTHWFSLLSEAEQQAIIARLEADRRAGLVVHRYLLDYLRDEGFSADGPLRRYLDTAFVPVVSFGYYELHLHRGRTIAPVATARFQPADRDGGASVEVVLAPPAGSSVAAIALRSLHTSGPALAEARPTAATPWRVEILQSDGTRASGPEPHTSTFGAEGILRITLPVEPASPWTRTRDTCVVLLDERGTEIAVAVFQP